MKNYYSIAIPKPCHEDWNQMSPKDKGRFCNSCSKTVVDFTKMETFEIQDFINEHKDSRICGHFKQTQLDSINLHIPAQVLAQQQSVHKLFLLVLLIVMGTTLMNCTNKNGDKRKIDSVEVRDSISNKVINVLDNVSKKSDSVTNKTYKSNLKEIQAVDLVIDGEMVIETVGDIEILEKHPNYIDSLSVITPTYCPFPEKDEGLEGEITLGMISVESPPEFPNTPQSFTIKEKRDYFSKRISEFVAEKFNTTVCLDLKGAQRIRTMFKVDSNGNIIDIKVRAPHIKLEEETIRVVKLLPQFIPAKQANKPIAIVYDLPIVFQVEE